MIPCQGCLLVVLSLLFLRLSAPSLHSGDLYENGIPVMEEEEKQRPGFLGGILNISVPKGKEAVLQCRVTNLGHFQVGWIQVDTQTILTIHTKVITHNNRISVSTGESGHLWNLHIRNVGEGDAGCYMCQINTLRMQKQTGCLDVHVPPDIVTEETSSDTTVSEGSDVTLACKAEGHPKPKVIWRREDSAPILVWDSDRLFSMDTVEGELLPLRGVHRKQSGAYLCIASNEVPPAVSKRILLTVNFPAEIKEDAQVVSVRRGSPLTLKCTVEASPQTVNYWLRNSSEILIASERYRIEERREGYRSEMFLTIREFQAQDEALYSCAAANSLGEVRGNISVREANWLGKDHALEVSNRSHFPDSTSSSWGVAKNGSSRPARLIRLIWLIRLIPVFATCLHRLR